MSRNRTDRLLARRVGPASGPGAPAPPGRQPEAVLVEKPLEVSRRDTLVATTMPTLGPDIELAAG